MTFKKCSKIILNGINTFIYNDKNNCWENFQKTKKSSGRIQSSHFEHEVENIIECEKSAIIEIINNELGELNASLKEIYFPEKGKNAEYDIKYILVINNIEIPILSNIKYWKNDTDNNNICGGFTTLVPFILLNCSLEDIEEKSYNINNVLKRTNYSFETDDPYEKDYFVQVFYKGAKNPIEKTQFASVFDSNIIFNSSQSGLGIQCSGKNLDFSEKYDIQEIKKKILEGLYKSKKPPNWWFELEKQVKK